MWSHLICLTSPRLSEAVTKGPSLQQLTHTPEVIRVTPFPELLNVNIKKGRHGNGCEREGGNENNLHDAVTVGLCHGHFSKPREHIAPSVTLNPGFGGS